MLRSRSWWLSILVLGLLAFGYSAVYAQNESPSPAPDQSPTVTPAAGAESPQPSGAAPAPAGAPPATTAQGGCGVLQLCGGDKDAGEQLYTNNCQSCHGPNLEGGVGFRLVPLQTCADQSAAGLKQCQDLTAAFITDKIKNGFPGTAMNPAAFPNITTDKQRADLAAFIISKNVAFISSGGKVTKTPLEKMIDNVWLIAIIVVVVLGITYGLSWYNMRWIAKKNA
jgi:mono/diheme cytochrome c family protein